MEDAQDLTFEKWVLLLHKDIANLNIRGVIGYWQQSQLLGARGVVLRQVILESVPEMKRKLSKGYEYLLDVSGSGYEGLVRLWRLRKLAKATLKNKEKKLRKLLRQPEYRDIYWLLGPLFISQIEKDEAYVLYLYFYTLTSPAYNVELNNFKRRFVSKGMNNRIISAQHNQKLIDEAKKKLVREPEI